MSRFPGYHYIYEDLRHLAPSNRVRAHRQQSGPGSTQFAPFQAPVDDFQGATEQFHSDIGRAFGFDSMFNDHECIMGFHMFSLESLQELFFDEALSLLENLVLDVTSVGETCYCESSTRTIGLDGRVHEEVLRTAHDGERCMRTSRAVRDGDMREERRTRIRPSSRRDCWADNRRPDVIVEEIDDEEEEGRESTQCGGPADTHGDVELEEVEVEEISEDGHPEGSSSADWIRERYRGWRNRA